MNVNCDIIRKTIASDYHLFFWGSWINLILSIFISVIINVVLTVAIVSFALKIYSNFLVKFMTDVEDRFDKKLDIYNKIEHLRKNDFNK